MEELTSHEAYVKSGKMWNWLADETEKRHRKVKKEEYFTALGIVGKYRPMSLCYCCEYDYFNEGLPCKHCPIYWKVAQQYGPTCMSSLYGEWINARDWREAAELARKIANLPERIV